MNVYTIIIDATGEILSQIIVPDDEHLALNTPEGATAIPGVAPADSYYVAGEWVAKPPRPSVYSTWNGTTKVWEDLRTLGQMKLDKWAEVKKAAAASDLTDMVIGANTYHLSLAERAAFFQQAQIAVQNGTSVTWHNVNDDAVVLTLAAVKTGITAIAARSDAIRAKALQLRALGVAATTPEQIAAISWSWP